MSSLKHAITAGLLFVLFGAMLVYRFFYWRVDSTPQEHTLVRGPPVRDSTATDLSPAITSVEYAAPFDSVAGSTSSSSPASDYSRPDVSEASMDTSESSFRRELRDQQWAAQAEALLSANLGGQYARAYYDLTIECRTTQCRILASIDAEALNTLGPGADWETMLTGLVTTVQNDAFDGESTFQSTDHSINRISFHSFVHRRVYSN